jgi:hypothetical protein
VNGGFVIKEEESICFLSHQLTVTILWRKKALTGLPIERLPHNAWFKGEHYA